MHVVPRWIGDSNFLPVTAHTKAIMDTLGGTWTDIREHWPEPDSAAESAAQGPTGSSEEN